MVSISVPLFGGQSCNMLCRYCCGELKDTEEWRNKKDSIKLDIDAFKKTLLSNPMVVDELKKPYEERHLDQWIWGGEPLIHLDAIKEWLQLCWDNLRDTFPTLTYAMSTNGIAIADDETFKFITDNGICLQLSHDGLGQWVRSGKFDPLYDIVTGPRLVTLANMGLLRWINCTLSSVNPSFFDNIKYFNDWREKYHLMDCNTLSEIKLNHIYDGDYDLNLSDHGFSEHQNLALTGEVLDRYMHEFESLAIMLRFISPENKYYLPFRGYIIEQTKRYNFMQSHDSDSGACRSFQRGLKDWTFVIDTIGKYCQCNLHDSSTNVDSPGGPQPEYCKGCEFELYTECNPCGAEQFPKKCEYHKALARMCMRMRELDKWMNATNNTKDKIDGNRDRD